MVSCYKISLVQNKTETVPVLVSGVPNSGTYQFSEPIEYGVCVLKEIAENLLVQGWTWNTNLGWVSFLCAGGTNSGIDCGSTPYGVSLNTKTGELSGYAWGDNIGWISIKCKGGKNGTADCGGVDYGVRVAVADNENGADCGTMKKGDLYGYAWADSVGWMNFCGAHVDLTALETPAETPPTDTGTTTPPADGTNPPYLETYPPELPAYQVARVTGNVKGNMIVDTKHLPVKSWISYPIGEPTSSDRERFLRTAKKSSSELTPDNEFFLLIFGLY